MQQSNLGSRTISVHEGEENNALGAVAPPIFQTANFSFNTMNELEEYLQNPLKSELFLYGRWGNPTARPPAAKIAALEGGEEAMLLSSGMAAISTATLTSLKSGDSILAPEEIYGGTHHLLRDFLPKYGIEARRFNIDSIGDLHDLIDETTKILLMETPSNPLTRIMDLSKASQIAHENNIMVIVDNTFAGPFNQRPLDLGADVVCHSTTKSLSGHSDIVGGAIVGKQDFIQKCWSISKILGGTPDPFALFLLNRGLKTYPLRMEKQNKSAQRLAEVLEENKHIKRVFYPGLTNHPDHQIAQNQMSGYGNMICFEVQGDLEVSRKVVEKLNIFKRAPSLGSIESLVSIPVLTSHSGLTTEELNRSGVTPGMIRLSVGIENVADLALDLKDAIFNPA